MAVCSGGRKYWQIDEIEFRNWKKKLCSKEKAKCLFLKHTLEIFRLLNNQIKLLRGSLGVELSQLIPQNLYCLKTKTPQAQVGQ